ncbi:MmyB family transcriptional regulator [Streptomyces sp. NPDC001073]
MRAERRRARLDEITSELNDRSPLFRQAWGVHHVSARMDSKKALHHPGFGVMDFFVEFVHVEGA